MIADVSNIMNHAIKAAEDFLGNTDKNNGKIFLPYDMDYGELKILNKNDKNHVNLQNNLQLHHRKLPHKHHQAHLHSNLL